MIGQTCTVAWCEVDHETSNNRWSHHMGRVWHFDTEQLAVSLWAGNACADRDRDVSPSLYLQVTNAECPEEVVQNVTLLELEALAALLSAAAADMASTLRWAEEARALNIA